MRTEDDLRAEVERLRDDIRQVNLAAVAEGRARDAAEAALAHAKAEALRELARVCFDEGDAGVVVGGIEIVETYVYDTIAALTGDAKDKANAELMREIVARVKR